MQEALELSISESSASQESAVVKETDEAPPTLDKEAPSPVVPVIGGEMVTVDSGETHYIYFT